MLEVFVELPNISIHAPPRGATSCDAVPPILTLFQFTPLREGRLFHSSTSTTTTPFQFTPLREGRRRSLYRSRALSAYFNSRPSARGDEMLLLVLVLLMIISIHAPPRGATVPGCSLFKPPCISIHAPPRGATAEQTQDSFTWTTFQFTPLREGRLGDTPGEPIPDALISIHAPPRGATRTAAQNVVQGYLFQFTPLREGRLDGLAGIGEFILISIHAPPRGATAHTGRIAIRWAFQFTPLREGRRRGADGGIHMGFYFNSRPSARGDGVVLTEEYTWDFISIHAPPRGATPIPRP